EALSGLDVDPTDCVMVGDRLQTDIQMALDTGMKSACVLTGEATADDVAALDVEHRPTWTLDRIDRLIPASAWRELGWTEDNDD
ncbi:HAD hydrolase-like protein, partial [Pseudomonas sp. 100_A]